MTPEDKQEIADALEEVHDLLAGDVVVLVKAGGGIQYTLTAMMEDIPPATGQGLIVDSAGLRDQRIRRVKLLKRDLEALGAEVEVSDHFLIYGEQWDFVPDEQLSDHTVPIAGIHNEMVCILRRAVELNKSIPGTEFTYAP